MIGKVVSHYKITEKLGEGGMGIVYKARDLKLDRFAALKFLPPSLTSDKESRKRFVQEAKAASSLDHNNICAIYEIDKTKPDQGELSESQTFIAMAYYEGKTLKEKIEEAKLEIGDVLEIVVQIAEGLGKAHGKNIIHRDIKPDNIFITKDGVVKILDFGLAKVAGQAHLTKAGSTYGTIAYMSPEQSSDGQIDKRTDIWSLGVVFYEMLTGQQPFKGEYEHAISYSIINETPPSPRELNPDISIELAGIVDKLLQKDPDDRYPDLSELMNDLRNILSGDAPTNRKMTVPAATTSKQKKVSIYTGIFTLLILTILYLADFFSAGSMDIKSIAILPLENLSGNEEQEYFVDGMTEALISELAKISALRVISRTSIMQYKKARKPITEIAEELNVDALVEGTVIQDNEKIRITVQLIKANPEQHLWASDYKRDLRNVIELQEEVAKSIAREIDISLTPEEEIRLSSARPVDPEVYRLYLKGHYLSDKVTKESLQKSIELFQQALALDPGYAPAYVGLAGAYLGLGFRGGFSDELLDQFEKSLAQASELDNTLFGTHRIKAMYKFWIEWDYMGAKEELEKALALNPNSAAARDLYCNTLLLTRNTREAIRQRELTFQLDPLSHMYHCNGTFTYLWARDYDQTIKVAEYTTEQFGSACAVEDLTIGMALFQQKKFEEAIRVLEKRNEMSKNNPRIMAELAASYAKAGNPGKAKEMLTELNNYGLRRIGKPFHYLEATVYVAMDETDLVFEHLRLSLDKKELFFPWLWGDPRFDPIRSDPRYKELTRNMDFPAKELRL